MPEPFLACLQPTADGDAVFLTVHVQPRAARPRLAGLYGDALKVAVTSPPVDDKANKAVIALLAKTLDLPKQRLAITGGQRSRTKRLRITAPAQEVDRRLRAMLADAGFPCEC